MPDNLSAQLTDSLQQAQLRAETMQQLQMVKNSLMGAGGIVAGGLAHGAAGAYAGMGMISPFLGASSGFLNQAMGRGMYASASAFGPRVGGPGGLLYESGLGSLLNKASGGYLFQDVNRSISQTAEQMRDSAKSELRLRGQEFVSNVKYGALTFGGLLDDSIAYRATGGYDERIRSGLTRQLAEQMGGPIGRTGVAGNVVNRVVSQIGKLNAEKMGYGLGASQQEELAKLALAFGGPVGSTTKDLGDKSSKFLEDFSKAVGKLGISADKLMSGYQELAKAGATNLDASKLFLSSVQTARSQNLFGSFGTDEFITQLASQTAISASSRGLRGAQADMMRNARFASVAQATREFEVIGANQSGVFGTGIAGLQSLQATREQLLSESMSAGGLFAVVNQQAALGLQSGAFSGVAGMLRGRAGTFGATLSNPLLALRYKLFPDVMASNVASKVGASGVLSAALNKSPAFQRNRLLRNLSSALAAEQLPTDVSSMDPEQRLAASKIVANAYGITDPQGMELFAQYLSKTPGGLESAISGKGLDAAQLAALNFATSEIGMIQEGLSGSAYDKSGKKSLGDFISGLSSDDIAAIAKNNKDAIERVALDRVDIDKLYFDILRDPSKGDELAQSAPNERLRNLYRRITAEARTNRGLFLKNKVDEPGLFSDAAMASAVKKASGGNIMGSIAKYDILNDELSDKGLKLLKDKAIGTKEYIRSLFRDPISAQRVDGSINKGTGPSETRVIGTVDVNIVGGLKPQ